MGCERVRIKINSNEVNMDKGFYTLLISGCSTVCLSDEEYIVTKKAISKLNENNIAYQLVTNSHDISGCELKEVSKNAPEVKV